MPSGAVRDEPVHPGDPPSIRAMFEGLAPDYDRLNRLLTFGLVDRWRRALARAAEVGRGSRVVDVCTGTGATLRRLDALVGPEGLAVGVDFTPAMLARADGHRVIGDALRLPLPDAAFDAAVSSFALRDVADQRALLAEMARVTRPGGRVALLEIGVPRRSLFRLGFRVWFHGVVPRVAAAAGQGAPFRFLARSLAYLPEPDALRRAMEDLGMVDVTWRELSLGAARLFAARTAATG